MVYDREVTINVRVSTKKADRSMSNMADDLVRTKEILKIFPSWKTKFDGLCNERLDALKAEAE